MVVIGKRFGKLTAVALAGKTANRLSIIDCTCDCGGRKQVRSDLLVQDKVKSCGCMKKGRKTNADREQKKREDIEKKKEDERFERVAEQDRKKTDQMWKKKYGERDKVDKMFDIFNT